MRGERGIKREGEEKREEKREGQRRRVVSEGMEREKVTGKSNRGKQKGLSI